MHGFAQRRNNRSNMRLKRGVSTQQRQLSRRLTPMNAEKIKTVQCFMPITHKGNELAPGRQ
jgi:hypothetical protein